MIAALKARRTLTAALATCGLVASCGKKSSTAAEISGLAVVPATAEVVVDIDVPRVASAPLIARAFDQLLARDPQLAARWQHVQDTCKGLTQVQHVLLAIGPKPTAQPGTGPVLVVATGKLSETEVAQCVRDVLGQGSGAVSIKEIAGRTMYVGRDGNRAMYFAFTRPDTLVLGADEAFITEALGSGKKLADVGERMRIVGQADQRAPIWAAGVVDERVRQGMVRASEGQIHAGPVGAFVSLDPTVGATLDLGVIMASADDAKALESFANTERGLLGYVAQARHIGKLVDKVAIKSKGEVVSFHVALDATEVNQLISALDDKGAAAQDSPPAPGSGSSGSGSGL